MTDHGSGFYDLIELTWPAGMDQPPLPDWLVEEWMPCGDCRANAFLDWHDGDWHLTIAHDDGCPALAGREHRHER